MGVHTTLVAAVHSGFSRSRPEDSRSLHFSPDFEAADASHPTSRPMFPPATDSEDPTSQIPWPSRRANGKQAKARGNRSRSPTQRTDAKNGGDGSNGKTSDSDPALKNRKSLLDLIALTVSMAGAQMTWTVELGYGTPFLLDLGLSEHLTSLVWLAGPISGLIAQPLIGAISDSSVSKYRRRYWVVTSTLVLIVATMALAYATAVAAILVDLFGGTQGRWDPDWKSQTKNTAIIIAVVAFYLLDFALNALQGSLRSLLLDVTPAEQLASANAWHGRMTHAGNIIGFTFGFVDLAGWRILRPLGGDQFRKVCIVAIIVLVATVWITCITQEEKEREREFPARESKNRTWEVARNIYRAVGDLPRPVRRVCYVQVCAFMGWFPFLFFSTTWVGEVMAQEIGSDPDPDRATRAGEFALLIYSIVAVIAGTVLPWLASRDRRLLKQIDSDAALDEDEEVDLEIAKIREMVRQWKAEAARQGRPLRLPTMPFMLRNIWTAALLLFAAIMMSTFFITTVYQATWAISLLGICWAVACWVPFAIIMEFLKEMDEKAAIERRNEGLARQNPSGPSIPRGRPLHSRVLSTPENLFRQGGGPNERTVLIRRHSMMGRNIETDPDADMGHVGPAPVAGGTILGIHNLAIVVPQFLIALISSAIFRLSDKHVPPNPDGPPYIYYGKNGVAWVLRFGGISALIGAAISRRVPPTKTEKQMRGRLAEMRESESLNV